MVAPGGDSAHPIISTDLNNSYYSAKGTSFSAPHVAAAAALLLSLKPSLSPNQIEDILGNTGDYIHSGRYGYPRLNTARALESLNPPSEPQSPIPPTDSPKPPPPTATPTPSRSIPWWCKYAPNHRYCQ